MSHASCALTAALSAFLKGLIATFLPAVSLSFLANVCPTLLAPGTSPAADATSFTIPPAFLNAAMFLTPPIIAGIRGPAILSIVDNIVALPCDISIASCPAATPVSIAAVPAAPIPGMKAAPIPTRVSTHDRKFKLDSFCASIDVLTSREDSFANGKFDPYPIGILPPLQIQH